MTSPTGTGPEAHRPLPAAPKSDKLDMRFKHAKILLRGRTPAEILRERIETEAKIVENKLKVNAFINHQVDCHLMSISGQHLAYAVRGHGITKIVSTLTGALFAQGVALHMGVPLVMAVDSPPLTSGPDTAVYHSILSGSVDDGTGLVTRTDSLYLSSEFVGPGDCILVLDIFLASGSTALALTDLVAKSGASLLGYGFMIEKRFEYGRQKLPAGIPVEALVSIASVEGGVVQFYEGGNNEMELS